MAEELDPIPIKIPAPVVDGQTGTKEEIKETAIDPSDIIDDPTDPRNGEARFLSWEHSKDQNGNEVLTAYTKDNKKIMMVVDEPPPPPKQYKVVVEELPEPEVVIEAPSEEPVNPKG